MTSCRETLEFSKYGWHVGKDFQGFWDEDPDIDPLPLVVAGWIQGLIQLSVGGIVIAAIYGKSVESKKSSLWNIAKQKGRLTQAKRFSSKCFALLLASTVSRNFAG